MTSLFDISFQTSQPYKTDGTMILVYRLADIKGLRPASIRPSPTLAWNVFLPF